MKKLTNKKGFTLMEMIIVIAIIVILAAISIPTLTANLDSANKAADEANLRSAKSAAVVYTMDKVVAANTKVYYDVTSGKIVETAPTTGYGKCTKHNGNYIEITYGANEEVTSVVWNVSTANAAYAGTCGN